MSALIVTATFGDGDNGWLQELRRTYYPPERNRVPAHLTLFHQLPPSVEAELAARLASASAAPPPPAMVVGVMNLGQGTALRVQSAALEGVRAELAEIFHMVLTEQDRGAWQPHVTIQNKVTAREARMLQNAIKVDFQPRPLAIRGLAAWRYREGPWEPVRVWPFRL